MEKIEILKTYDNGIGFKEAMKIAEHKRIELLSNSEVDVILQDDKEYQRCKDVFTCWTGTLLIYEAPNKPFGNSVKYNEYSIEIPTAYQGKKNCALKVEYGDYDFEDYLFKLRPKAKVILIEEFPRTDGWYLTEEGIPCGLKVASGNKDARYLWRQDNSASVGPLARGDVGGWDDGRRRDVVALRRPDDGLGVVGKAKSKPSQEKNKGSKVEKENKNAYEEAVEKCCYAIEEHDNQTATRDYLDAITYILLTANEKQLKEAKP